MVYPFLVILVCLINTFVQNSDRYEKNWSSNMVSTELVYSDYSLYLRIENKSDDSIYVITDIFENLQVFFNRKRVSTTFLYGFDSLPLFPAPPHYDSLDQTYQRIAAYFNLQNPEEADSILFDHLINEYCKLNKKVNINPEERSILKSKFEVALFFTGGILLLPPHDSYTFRKKYNCFEKNRGKYKIKCKYSRNKHKYYYAEGVSGDTIVKLPNSPPKKFLGFSRYDGRLKCKTIRFFTQ